MIQATSCSKVDVNPFSASSNRAAFGHGLTAVRMRRTATPISNGFFSMEFTSIHRFTTESADHPPVLSCCGIEKDTSIIPTDLSLPLRQESKLALGRSNREN